VLMLVYFIFCLPALRPLRGRVAAVEEEEGRLQKQTQNQKQKK
jgi:hypothetical protein